MLPVELERVSGVLRPVLVVDIEFGASVKVLHGEWSRRILRLIYGTIPL
jgi:hypothetical protein